MSSPREPLGDGPPPPDATVVLDPQPDSTRVMEPLPEPAAEPPVRPAPAFRLAPPPPPPVQLHPRPAPPAPPPVSSVPVAPPVPARTRRLPLGVLAAVVAAVVVAGVAVAGFRSGALGGGRPATSSSAAAAAVPVPADQVRASASSTQDQDGTITYDAANTLDGRPETAWNSNGQGAGASLTYTFATPVDLASITVLNGYQKTRTTSSGATVDLFALNQRVRTLQVVTDAGTVEWTLRDDRAPQTLSRAFGRTRTVRLQVVSTYPSTKYKDLAVSEVRFTARG